MRDLLFTGALLFPVWWLVFASIAHALSGTPFSYEIRVNLGTNWLQILLSILLIGPILIVLHEWCHGLAFRLNGFRPRYGFRWVYAYATAPNAVMTRRQALAVALAPFVLITLCGIPLLRLLPSSFVPYVVLFLATNAAGAIGDMWLTWTLLRFPHPVLVVDYKDRWEFYAPIQPEAAPVVYSSGILLRFCSFSAMIFFISLIVASLVPILATAMGMESLHVGPQGSWALLDFQMVPNEGFTYSVSIPALLVLSIIGGALLTYYTSKRSPNRPASSNALSNS